MKELCLLVPDVDEFPAALELSAFTLSMRWLNVSVKVTKCFIEPVISNVKKEINILKIP